MNVTGGTARYRTLGRTGLRVSEIGCGTATLGLTNYIERWDAQSAEKCLNNASEHFIKLGNEPGGAAVLRLLADLYEQAGNEESAIRCLERVVLVDTRYGLFQYRQDNTRLSGLLEQRRKA